MKTNKEYATNLKSGIITSDMLYDCLFSLNKRAKNCRDQKNRYRRSEYYYGYVEKMNEYYNQKDFLLKTMLKPSLIHKQISENWYGIKNTLYFLFFEMVQGTFHLPIDEQYVKKGNHGLKVERIQDDFYTQGKSIETLVSVQFVKKLIEFVKTNEYKYIE